MALVDSGTTNNFVSQAVTDSFEMQLSKARSQNREVAKLSEIATINGELLCTTGIVLYMVHMSNSAGVKHCHMINFVVADIANYNVILGMAWPLKQNPDIC